MNPQTEKILSKPTCTVAEVAELTGLSPGTVYNGVARGSVKAIRFGRRIIIPTIYVREMLGFEEGQRSKGAA